MERRLEDWIRTDLSARPQEKEPLSYVLGALGLVAVGALVLRAIWLEGLNASWLWTAVVVGVVAFAVVHLSRRTCRQLAYLRAHPQPATREDFRGAAVMVAMFTILMWFVAWLLGQ